MPTQDRITANARIARVRRASREVTKCALLECNAVVDDHVLSLCVRVCVCVLHQNIGVVHACSVVLYVSRVSRVSVGCEFECSGVACIIWMLRDVFCIILYAVWIKDGVSILYFLRNSY